MAQTPEQKLDKINDVANINNVDAADEPNVVSFKNEIRSLRTQLELGAAVTALQFESKVGDFMRNVLTELTNDIDQYNALVILYGKLRTSTLLTGATLAPLATPATPPTNADVTDALTKIADFAGGAFLAYFRANPRSGTGGAGGAGAGGGGGAAGGAGAGGAGAGAGGGTGTGGARGAGFVAPAKASNLYRDDYADGLARANLFNRSDLDDERDEYIDAKAAEIGNANLSELTNPAEANALKVAEIALDGYLKDMDEITKRRIATKIEDNEDAGFFRNAYQSFETMVENNKLATTLGLAAVGCFFPGSTPFVLAAKFGLGMIASKGIAERGVNYFTGSIGNNKSVLSNSNTFAVRKHSDAGEDSFANRKELFSDGSKKVVSEAERKYKASTKRRIRTLAAEPRYQAADATGRMTLILEIIKDEQNKMLQILEDQTKGMRALGKKTAEWALAAGYTAGTLFVGHQIGSAIQAGFGSMTEGLFEGGSGGGNGTNLGRNLPNFFPNTEATGGAADPEGGSWLQRLFADPDNTDTGGGASESTGDTNRRTWADWWRGEPEAPTPGDANGDGIKDKDTSGYKPPDPIVNDPKEPIVSQTTTSPGSGNTTTTPDNTGSSSGGNAPASNGPDTAVDISDSGIPTIDDELKRPFVYRESFNPDRSLINIYDTSEGLTEINYPTDRLEDMQVILNTPAGINSLEELPVFNAEGEILQGESGSVARGSRLTLTGESTIFNQATANGGTEQVRYFQVQNADGTPGGYVQGLFLQQAAMPDLANNPPVPSDSAAVRLSQPTAFTAGLNDPITTINYAVNSPVPGVPIPNMPEYNTDTGRR